MDKYNFFKQGGTLPQNRIKVDLPDKMDVNCAALMYDSEGRFFPDLSNLVDTKVQVENRDCVEAAMELIDAGYNPAMLNLADLYTPGGLVEYGSGAQEENLCRRSNLSLSLYPFS